MKKQWMHMLVWSLIVASWLVEYAYFLTNLFGVPCNSYYALAYLLLLDLCILKKIGSNTNRKYEIYVEVFGRLLAVNGIWSLYFFAFEIAEGFWQVLGKIILLTILESAVFVMMFSLYKMMIRVSKKAGVFFIKNTDSMEEAVKGIDQSETVFLQDIPAERRNSLLKYCYEQERQVYCTTKLSDIIIRGSSLAQYSDTPVLFYDRFGIGIGKTAVKRILDIFFASLLLIVLSPVGLIIACCIKLEDGGRVFYHQTRCTQNMKQFQIFKYRSMVEDAEKIKGVMLASKNDRRLTKVGKFIRNTKLDELPQLWNILKGEMSFVGPRPERPEFIKEALEGIPEFILRTKVKAGLTGYAQVMGNYNTEFLDKLKWDLMYIENYSLFLDFKIVMMTAAAIFQKENHEDFSKWEK